MTDSEDELPEEPDRPGGNGLMVGGVILAAIAVIGFPYQLGTIQSGECIDSCQPTAIAIPAVLLITGIILFVIGWRRMHP